MREEHLALMRVYLEALKRSEERAANLAFELGLTRLGNSILENIVTIEQQIIELPSSEVDQESANQSSN
jgi:hypothetical protein